MSIFDKFVHTPEHVDEIECVVIGNAGGVSGRINFKIIDGGAIVSEQRNGDLMESLPQNLQNHARLLGEGVLALAKGVV
jgi:hypothetical protein